MPQILDVEGVDGVFIGPADQSADMGFSGNRSIRKCRPPLSAIAQIRAGGQQRRDPDGQRTAGEGYLQLGALFVAVGVDTTLLARGA